MGLGAAEMVAVFGHDHEFLLLVVIEDGDAKGIGAGRHPFLVTKFVGVLLFPSHGVDMCMYS